MKKSISKKILQFIAIFEPAEEGGYVVYVPAIPGCATQGETLEEAESMIKEAVDLCLEVAKEDKEYYQKINWSNTTNLNN